jgi:hypothetical protein
MQSAVATMEALLIAPIMVGRSGGNEAFASKGKWG